MRGAADPSGPLAAEGQSAATGQYCSPFSNRGSNCVLSANQQCVRHLTTVCFQGSLELEKLRQDFQMSFRLIQWCSSGSVGDKNRREQGARRVSKKSNWIGHKTGQRCICSPSPR